MFVDQKLQNKTHINRAVVSFKSELCITYNIIFNRPLFEAVIQHRRKQFSKTANKGNPPVVALVIYFALLLNWNNDSFRSLHWKFAAI